MYKMNYDRAVEALWDELLKRDIHEAYYDAVPAIYGSSGGPTKNLGAAIAGTKKVVEVLVKWILEIDELDQSETMAFVLRHKILIADRIDRILDKEEIVRQIKRRRLLR